MQNKLFQTLLIATLISPSIGLAKEATERAVLDADKRGDIAFAADEEPGSKFPSAPPKYTPYKDLPPDWVKNGPHKDVPIENPTLLPPWAKKLQPSPAPDTPKQ